MNIVTAVKIVPDDQDIRVADDRSLDYSKARPVVSTYDLNAIEAGARAAEAQGATHAVVSVGGSFIDDTKNNKNILARGVDSLTLVVDDAYADLDARATAAVLAEAVKGLEPDVVFCGDGSADAYAQQVDVHLAEALGIPIITAVSSVDFEDGVLVADRTLESEREVVEAPLPVVVSVLPDIALPRICGMRDIMQAGKKPVSKIGGIAVETGTVALETLAPEPAPRKQVLFDSADEDGVERFTAALVEALR